MTDRESHAATDRPAPFVTRVLSRLGFRAQGAPEGETIQQPLARITTPQNGWLPMNWGIGWWQQGYNPLHSGENATVDACVWAYVRAIAQLPGYHRQKEDTNEVIDLTGTALSRLLRFPNTYETSSDFLTHTVRSLLYEGNAYWLAWPRNQRNEVTALHWLNPKTCRPYVAETGEIFYSVGDNPILTGEMERDIRDRWLVPQRDMLHVKLATPRDPLIGETWLSSLASDLANRAAMNINVASFFQNMSRPSGILSTDQILSAEQVEALRVRWNAQSTGLNAGGVPILTAGLKWQALSMNAQDAQLVEALKLNDKAIAGVFGVPGVMIGITDQSAFGNSTEALMAFWLSNGLGYILNHIEQAIDQFFGLPQNQFTEYDTDALLRTVLRDRIEALARGVQGGIYAPNEARDREGLKRVKAGDEPRVQQQQVPLSFASEGSIPPVAGQQGVATTPGIAPPGAAPAADDAANDDTAEESDSAKANRRLIVRLLARERIGARIQRGMKDG